MLITRHMLISGQDQLIFFLGYTPRVSDIDQLFLLSQVVTGGILFYILVTEGPLFSL